MVSGTLPQFSTDLEHGGRWTSLRLGGREWLWHRDDPARDLVSPGDAFVDAGGLEECVPTVRGTPDHGSVWSRAWRSVGDEDVVDSGSFLLRRRISAGLDEVTAMYRLEADPGYRFIWTAHALLDLQVGARIELAAELPVRLYPESASLLEVDWPPGWPSLVDRWPRPFGLAIGELGPDDGTAIGATVLDTPTVDVIDGGQQLRMRVEAEPNVPVSISIWRNLGGFPPGSPYRSVGVEPMLGRVFDLADAGPDDAVTVPASGYVAWTLYLEGSR